MRVLELYSGIGGMHMALKESGVQGEIICSVDINPVANSIYKHNFPDTQLLNRNIQGLSAKFINRLGADTILMSPPCQPFTRNGLQADTGDARTNSFKYLLDLLPQLDGIERILVENVKGFEESKMRDLMINKFAECNYLCREFLLSPTQFGVPNSRLRYYCIARKRELGPLPDVSCEQGECFRIQDIAEGDNLDTNYLLSDKVLEKYVLVSDICYPDSRNSCCFTKAYGRYIEGTGSIFTPVDRDTVRKAFEDFVLGNVEGVRRLRLRFFTPREVCRLMSFPETFTFPDSTTDRQRYNVLGNSINVKVVAQLIKLLNC